MRVVIAEDSALLRDSLAGALAAKGVEVVGTAGTGDELESLVARLHPDAAIVDIRMPPTHTTEGLEATTRLRAARPGFPVLVLSHHVESRIAIDLLRDDPDGIGYLLKDRVSRIDEIVGTLERLVAGGSVIDPSVVSALLGRRRVHDPLDELTPREREVLALMAEGRSNRAIAEALGVEDKTVEYHVGQVFDKLALDRHGRGHRRVLAVLAWLSADRQATRGGGSGDGPSSG
jgi:DNA-binding NarL/FixJ family response regulator